MKPTSPARPIICTTTTSRTKTSDINIRAVMIVDVVVAVVCLSPPG